MAFANKYHFRFDSVNGVEYNIYILKDGYSGQVIQRALGRAPVIKKKKNGPIHGTSLELYVECAVDGEFAELYTSDPKAFRVDVYRGRATHTLIWTGFVSTELYSEPSIAPPYDVQIVATDGLGELKLNNFEPQGETWLRALFLNLLSLTGSNRPFYFATNLYNTGGTRAQMLNWTINVDFLEGKTCYEVLTQLLESIHATITTYGSRWLIARETDIETLLDSGGDLSVIAVSANGGATSITTIGGARRTLGQKGVADFWPVGYLSTAIEPAKKSVAVQAAWYLVSALQGGILDIPANFDYWLKDNWVTLDIDSMTYKPSTHYQGLTCYIGDGLTGSNYGFIAQSFSMLNINDLVFEIEIKVRPDYWYPTGQTTPRRGEVNVYLKYTTANSTHYGIANRGWTTSEPTDYMVLGEVSLSNQTLKFSIPRVMGLGASNGTLILYIQGRNIVVNKVSMKISRGEKGYIDTVYIDNGARGEADMIEILGGRVLQDNIQNPDFYQGIWKYEGEPLCSFTDSNHTNGDFMSIQALDRAVSVALPRKRTEGVVDMPAAYAMFPLIFRQGQQNSWIETFEWDLLQEDVKISAVSTPNAQIAVESETVEPMEGGGSSSSGGSSGGGSGGGGGTGTVTSVALSAPTGFSVGGSPITGAGTLQLSFQSGYALPTIENVNKGVAAYGWGNHALAGYLKTAADIAAALGYVPANSLNGLQRPRIKIIRGMADPNSRPAPRLMAEHPLVGSVNSPSDACFVLMVYCKRRGKKAMVDTIQYRDKWGEARGKLATSEALTFTAQAPSGSDPALHLSAEIPLDTLRYHILNNYISLKGEPLPTSMSITDFKSSNKMARFARRAYFSGTDAEWKAKTHSSRLFGIAVRYTNPAFTGLVSGPLAETTRSINGIPRYIYSDITPIRVTVGQESVPHINLRGESAVKATAYNPNTIGFQLGVGMA